MEPKGSLLHSQVPSTCPYPEPARSRASHFLKIHLNIILPSTPGSPTWSRSFRFPHQNPVYASPLPHMRYMSRPSHSSRFYYPNNNAKPWRTGICFMTTYEEIGKIKGEMEVTRRRGRIHKKLLDDLKDRRGYSHLKGEALDRTMWRNRFRGGFGPVVRQNTEWMNEEITIFRWTKKDSAHIYVLYVRCVLFQHSFYIRSKWKHTLGRFA